MDADKPATVGGDTVDTSTVGQYTVTYDCTDTSNNEATQVSRTVNVQTAVTPVTTLLADAFITTWRTDSANQTITIPVGGSTARYSIDWGDNSPAETDITGDSTHTYREADSYTVSISGGLERIYLDGQQPNAGRLASIEQWGDTRWTTMDAAFDGATNMVYRATDTPDLSGVTDMHRMFGDAYAFNGDLSSWDVSKVTDMSDMFIFAYDFNGNLSSWDVSSVTNMNEMFAVATSFNGDLSSWDVSKVTDMFAMFSAADSFDADLSGWDVSSVATMSVMFRGASSFDADLSGWDVSSVAAMSVMFRDASSFNADISGWDVSRVTDMYTMFNQANAFDQNLGKWYIVLDDTVIEGDSATGTVEIIAAQNSFLGAQNPAYGIGSGVDSASFEMDGASLRLKAVSDRLTGDSYTVNVTSSGGFGTNNFRILEVSVKVSGILPATGTDINQTPLAEPTVPPEAPQNLRAASTDTTVTLIWDSPDDDSITGYKILSRTPATQSQLFVLVDDTGAPGTSYVIEDLDPDTVYVFRVIAINAHGESDNSNFVRLSTLS